MVLDTGCCVCTAASTALSTAALLVVVKNTDACPLLVLKGASPAASQAAPCFEQHIFCDAAAWVLPEHVTCKMVNELTRGGPPRVNERRQRPYDSRPDVAEEVRLSDVQGKHPPRYKALEW